MQDYIMCDLPKQNWGLKPKYNNNKLRCLHLLEIYFGYLETKNTYYIF